MLRQDEEDEALTKRAKAVLVEDGTIFDEASVDQIVSELRGIHAGTEAVKSRMVEIGRRLLPEAARPDSKVQPERLGAPCELLPDAAEAQEGQGLPEHASGR